MQIVETADASAAGQVQVGELGKERLTERAGTCAAAHPHIGQIEHDEP